jgi:hypothetical protein
LILNKTAETQTRSMKVSSVLSVFFFNIVITCFLNYFLLEKYQIDVFKLFLNDFDMLVSKIKKNYFDTFSIENHSTLKYQTHNLQ